MIAGHLAHSETLSPERMTGLADGTVGRVVDIVSGPLQVRLAESAADIDAAQALRYRVFYETMGARPLPGMAPVRRDSDPFDEICDHLLVLDHSRGDGAKAIVGTYRLIRRDAARRCGRFYSAAEYDISRLISYRGEILELGRSCVDPSYRTRPTMPLLWSGIAAYVFHYDIALDVRLRQPAGHRSRCAGSRRCPISITITRRRRGCGRARWSSVTST